MLSRALLVAASRSSRHVQMQAAFSSAHAHATAESSSESGDESTPPTPHPEKKLDKGDDFKRAEEDRASSSSSPPSSSTSSEQQQQQPSIDFSDTSASFASVPTSKLLRSAATLGACAYSPPWLVERAAAAYTGSSSSSSASSGGGVGGGGLFPSLVGAFLSRALYPHFCAGATAEEASRVADELSERGVGSILNYAAEEAVEDEDEEGEGGGEGGGKNSSSRGERRRDAAAELFLASVAGARPSPRPGRPSWVAIKMSALAPPSVLERASSAIVSASEEAAKLAGNDSPLYDRGLWACDDALASALERHAASSKLDEGDVAALKRAEERLRKIALAASVRTNTRVIVDAEQTWLQPIIDVLAVRAMREFNDNVKTENDPAIVQTYQCYLTSTPRRVAADAARASREGFVLGAKPVRGAYLAAERARAASKGLPDPTHASIGATHACYDGVVQTLLDGVAASREKKKKNATHLLVASHNRASVERAVEGMRSRGLLGGGGRGGSRGGGGGGSYDGPSVPVSFGQLLGMADSLTFGLAARGLDALKILAYGDLRVVCSFLVRRAQENASALGGARAESRAQMKEVARRMMVSRK